MHIWFFSILEFFLHSKLAGTQYCIERRESLETLLLVICKVVQTKTGHWWGFDLQRLTLGAGGLWGISGSIQPAGFPAASTSDLTRPYRDLWKMKSITSNVWGSGALEFSCSPLQGFSASKTSWKLFRSENPALLVRAFVNIMIQELMLIWKKPKPVCFFLVGSTRALCKQFNTSQCISCACSLFGIEAWKI